MRSLISIKPLVLAALSLMLTAVGAAQGQGGRIELGQLDRLSSIAKQTVDVSIDERLIQLTAKFLSSKDLEEAKLKELVNGLKGIYVRSFEFESDGQYSKADLETIRSQLRGPGWQRVVGVVSKREGNLEVYLMTEANKISGLAVLAADPNELTVVNIIGPVDIEKLSQLDGQFGIPDLEIETKPKPKN